MRDSTLTIRLNGETREVRSGTSVAELVEDMGLDPSRIAIELDKDILVRQLWSTTLLCDGSSVEIVHFVGGG